MLWEWDDQVMCFTLKSYSEHISYKLLVTIIWTLSGMFFYICNYLFQIDKRKKQHAIVDLNWVSYL